MRFLHTSDWHIGRTFHQVSLLDELRQVFAALVELVVREEVDVVVASGDIFDSSTPSADAVRLLDQILLDLADVGVRVVMTSGNHDSPARLGAKAAFAHKAGIHVITQSEEITSPVTIDDEHGPVHFYGVPFLEPAHQRHIWSEVEPLRSQKDAMGHALGLVRDDWQRRGGRAVVLAHTFVQGADGESCDSERDIVGGVDKVPVNYFSDFTYAALGHIHGRAVLAPTVRYSGAPLHYSFSEAGKRRGGWIVDLDADGTREVRWLDLPVPRELSILSGTLEELLTDEVHAAAVGHWVSATVTDQVRPSNTMRRLQGRFPHAVELVFAPSHVHGPDATTYAARIRSRTDHEIVEVFLEAVRNGAGMSDEEAVLVRDVIGSRSPR
ncbi:exonuclease SbcCD subunit D [Nocardioides gilvus]|uniref:exonuclease SbcCD subunit D n=1 Tax=Nocardioides gilvus TaxID=1735589 RepID=UPI000D747296|nr:exonuclease SbcCD subunit D [Nocardioides gilvus]